MHNITPAARAALEKAREEWDRHEKVQGPRRGRSGRQEGGRLGKPSNSPTSWARLSTRPKLTTDKWWDKKKDGEGDDDDDDGDDDDDDDGDSEDDMAPRRARRLSQAAPPRDARGGVMWS